MKIADPSDDAAAREALLRGLFEWAVVVDRDGRISRTVVGSLQAGSAVQDLFAAAERAEIRRALMAVAENGVPIRCDVLAEGGSADPLELHVLPGDAALVADGVLLAARYPGSEGRFEEPVDALRASEKRFRTLLEHAPEAIVILDVEHGSYVDVNRMARRLYGLSQRELLASNPVALSPEFQPDGRRSDEAARAYIEAALAGETPVFEWTHTHSDGHDVQVEARLVRLPDPHRQLVRGSLIDISERKAAERDREQLRQHLLEAQKMEALGQLTGGVAHDFNNLLTVIIGNLELARLRESEPLEPDSPIEQAIEACRRAASLTQRLLAFARRQALQPRAVDLNQLIDGMNSLLRQAAGETIDIEQKFDAELWACEVDPAQMENAILNLVLNARDAMPDGGRVVLETSNCSVVGGEACARLPGRHIRLSVVDTGVGMSEDVRTQVVEPFFTTKGIGEGSGLGLSMVYGFVKQSNGRLVIRSAVGEGTRIDIELPATNAAVNDADRSGPDSDGAGAGSGQLVLIVEDDAYVRRLSRRLIRSLGYRTVEAGDAAAAMACLERHADIDLLFTDVVLPGGCSGAELVQSAVRRWPGLCAVYTSGYTRDELPPGRDGIELIQKPFTGAQLAECFARSLAARTR